MTSIPTVMKKPELDEQFWTDKYLDQSTGWDLGALSPPVKAYADQLLDKDISILIPGAGNAYEAEYLVVLDVSAEPLKNFQRRNPEFPSEQLVHQNFFDHQGKYDLIIEQTFFCALSPSLRGRYVEKMHGLLGQGGKLAGLLFDFPLTEQGPPFGGSLEEYTAAFSKYFAIKTMDRCFNSVKPRLGRELFIIFEKKN